MGEPNEKKPAPTAGFATLMKWAGYLTALLTLIFGLQQLSKQISDRASARKQMATLLNTAHVQANAHDYAAAWATIEKALQADQNSAPAHAAQEEVGMQWIENARTHGNERFTDLTEKLEPVLARGVTMARSPQHEADLLAHLGWVDFLRGREGRSELDPAAWFAKSTAKDSSNPYGHAMWGFWILWKGGSLDQAGPHFESALSSGRARPYVRDLQLAALLNRGPDADPADVIRVLNAMRRGQEPLSDEMRPRILRIYDQRMVPYRPETAAFVAAVPPSDHLALFHWLFDPLPADESALVHRSYYLALIEEASGDKSAALADLRGVRAKISRYPGSLLEAVDSGIKRLSGGR